jgi:hypothetical protein
MIEVAPAPSEKTSRYSTATYVALGLSLVFFFSSFVFLASEQAQRKLRALLGPSDRIILSVANADLVGNGTVYRVLKILSHEGISIEVYGAAAGGKQRALVDSFQLPDKRDGHFHVGGQATNLALKDLDNDGHPEIVAPTYDLELKPHLNALKLNPETNKIEPYTGVVP